MNGVTSGLGFTTGIGPQISGQGGAATVLVPTPNFSFSSCTGGAGGNACLFGFNFTVLRDFTIWGAANSLNGSTNNKVILDTGLEGRAYGIGVTGWGASDTALTAISTNQSWLVSSHVTGAGKTGISVSGVNNSFVNVVSEYNTGSAISVPSGASLASLGGVYGRGFSTTTSANITGKLVSVNDAWLGAVNGSANTALACFNGATCYLTQSSAVSTVSGGNGLFVQAGAVAHASRSIFTGAGAGGSVNNAGTYFDEGGNSYTTAVIGLAPTCAMTTGGGTGPACALVAGSTNEKGTVRMTPGTTPGTAGTTTITFAGTFAGAANTTPSCTFSEANTGTGTWNAVAAAIQLNVRSTTAPIFAWNNTVALTAASTYDVDYVCVAR